MRFSILLFYIVLHTLSTYGQKSGVCIAFYNLENIFDTLDTYDLIDASKSFSDPEFITIVPKTPELKEQLKNQPYVNLGKADIKNFKDWLYNYEVTLEDGSKKKYGSYLYYKDTRDDDNTADGSRQYDGKVYWHKLGQLAKVLSEIGTEKITGGAAVIGVAEVETKAVLEDLVALPSLKDRNYQVIHFNSLDSRGVDVGLLYNPTYFEPIQSKKLFVSIYDNMKKAENNPDAVKYFTRDILWVEGLLNGELVHFFVNHWPSKRGGDKRSEPSRIEAARVARVVIDSLLAADKDAKIFFMGDFNDDPVSKSIAVTLNAKGKPDISSKELYNPYVDFYKKGFGTLSYNGVRNLFDQIIISKGLLNKNGYQFHSAKIFNEQYLTTHSYPFSGGPFRSYGGDVYLGGYSDHLPVYIFLKKE